MLKGKHIGIIGCGNMGEALIKGILGKGLVPKSRLLMNDIRKSRLFYIKHRYGIKQMDSEELAKRCNIIVLAMKPQDLNSVMNRISWNLTSRKLLISILAGVRIGRIGLRSGKKVQVVRVMPNMGALIGEAVSAMSFAKGVKKENKAIARRIFASFGDVIEVNESKMDAITAISGSGPAYFFYLVELLVNSALRLGIEKERAEKLVIKTAIGSAALLARMKQSPQTLRHRITSKKGTTEAAINVFKHRNLEAIIREAVAAAAKRSRELSGGV